LGLWASSGKHDTIRTENMEKDCKKRQKNAAKKRHKETTECKRRIS
jgi:hypothetical protein